MRFTQFLVLAGALLVAAPAVAQDNATAPANAAANTAVDANASNAAPPINGPAVDQNAPEAAAAPAPAASTAPPPEEENHGFPFGVLGLIGLLGLFGVRKVKG